MKRINSFVRCLTAVLLVVLLGGCKPSPEQQAKSEQRKKEYCLDHSCLGDVQLKFDPKTEIPFKKGGHWFVAPRTYNGYEGSLAFYWPSKTPMAGLGGEHYPEQGKDYSTVAIEFFIESMPPEIKLSDVIEKAESEKRIHSRVSIRPELEKVEIKENEGRPNGLGTYYVSVQEKTYSGWPPIVYCDESSEKGWCGADFLWKHGLKIYVRFNQTHGKDWPEIYSEINRVLNLIREA